jgi:hypothetical protein
MPAAARTRASPAKRKHRAQRRQETGNGKLTFKLQILELGLGKTHKVCKKFVSSIDRKRRAAVL